MIKTGLDRYVKTPLVLESVLTFRENTGAAGAWSLYSIKMEQRPSLTKRLKEHNECGQDWLMTKSLLRKLIDEDRWDEIGRQFNFTPQFCLFEGKTYFNWQSAPEPMLLLAGWTGRPPDHRVKRFKYKIGPSTPTPKPPKYKPGEATKQLLTRLFDGEQNGCCFYCGKPTSPKDRSKDHLTPRSRGGPASHHANLVGACKTCNHAKGNMTLQEFLDTDYLTQDRRAALGRSGPPTIRFPHAKQNHHQRLPPHLRPIPTPRKQKDTGLHPIDKHRLTAKAIASGLTAGWPDGDIQ